jgi:hypothetical protein
MKFVRDFISKYLMTSLQPGWLTIQTDDGVITISYWVPLNYRLADNTVSQKQLPINPTSHCTI